MLRFITCFNSCKNHPCVSEAEGCSTILLYHGALCFILPSVAVSACYKFSLWNPRDMKLPKVPILRHFSPIETLPTSALIKNHTYYLLQNCRIVMLRVSMPATVLCAYPVSCMLHSLPNSLLLITVTIDGITAFKASWCLNTLSWFLHS